MDEIKAGDLQYRYQVRYQYPRDSGWYTLAGFPAFNLAVAALKVMYPPNVTEESLGQLAIVDTLPQLPPIWERPKEEELAPPEQPDPE